jgi:hypothetical protein
MEESIKLNDLMLHSEGDVKRFFDKFVCHLQYLIISVSEIIRVVFTFLSLWHLINDLHSTFIVFAELGFVFSLPLWAARRFSVQIHVAFQLHEWRPYRSETGA